MKWTANDAYLFLVFFCLFVFIYVLPLQGNPGKENLEGRDEALIV